MSNLVTATFKTRRAAENVVRDLQDIGVNENQISIVITEEDHAPNIRRSALGKKEEGSATGAAAGGILGAMAGAMVALSSTVIPGTNIMVAGPVLSIAGGLGVGILLGGLCGFLIGAGLSEHKARQYEDAVQQGAILFVLKLKDHQQKEQAKRIFEKKRDDVLDYEYHSQNNALHN